MKQERIVLLEYELNIAHRTIQVQNKFEQHSNLPVSLGKERESLRSLYFTLAKCQADNDGVSKELCKKIEEVAFLRSQVEEYESIINMVQYENGRLLYKLECESTLARSSRESLEQLSQQHTVLELQYNTLQSESSKKDDEIISQKQCYERNIMVKDQESHAIQEKLLASMSCQQQATERISSLENAIDQLNFSLQNTIQVYEKEKSALSAALQTAQGKIDEYRILEHEHHTLVHEIQQRRTDLDDAKIHLISSQHELAAIQDSNHALNYQLLAEQSYAQTLREEVQTLQTTLAVTLRERDEVVQALRQSMDFTKGLMHRIDEEKKVSEELEKRLQEEISLRKKVSLVMLDTMRKQYPMSISQPIGLEKGSSRVGYSWLHDRNTVKQVLEEAKIMSMQRTSEKNNQSYLATAPSPVSPSIQVDHDLLRKLTASQDVEIKILKEALLNEDESSLGKKVSSANTSIDSSLRGLTEDQQQQTHDVDSNSGESLDLMQLSK